MAERHLIDQYLSVLRRTLGPLRRTPDLIAEVEDHLLLSITEKTATGIDPTTAQTQALQQLGDPWVLAVSLATGSGSGAGLALPSVMTRVAGKAAVIGGAGWIITSVLIQIWRSNTSGHQGITGDLWVLNDIAGLAAYFGTLLALCGILARSGAARAPSSILALIGAALGMLNSFPTSGRAVSLLLTALLIAASTAVAWRWFETLRGSLWPLVLLPVGPLIEFAALLLYRFTEQSIGPWQPAPAVFEVGMIIFGIALGGSAFLLHQTNHTADDRGREMTTF